jgi:hypothetical protein
MTTWYLRVLHDTVVGPRPPNGIIGLRDIDHPCEGFDDTPRDPDDQSGDCSTDGHYMCIECKHLNLTSDYASRRGMNPNIEDNYDD